jgi:hypothetical protein
VSEYEVRCARFVGRLSTVSLVVGLVVAGVVTLDGSDRSLRVGAVAVAACILLSLVLLDLSQNWHSRPRVLRRIFPTNARRAS